MRRVALPLIALVALFLGVVNASGHATATRTITVEVLGKGTVKSSHVSGVNCGGGNTKCCRHVRGPAAGHADGEAG